MELETTISVTFTTTKTMSYLNNDPDYSNFRPLMIATPSRVEVSIPTTTLDSTTVLSTSESVLLSLEATVSSVSSPVDFGSDTSYTPEPTVSNIVESVTQYNSDDSAKLGMAIGIPVGVVVLILVAVGTWYYLKSKKATNSTILPLSYNQGFHVSSSSDSNSFNQKNPYITEYKSESFGNNRGKHIPFNLDLELEENLERYQAKSILTPINYKSVPNRIKAEPSQWFNRLSRMVRIDDTGDETTGISPLFLKRFHLNKPFTPKTPKTPKHSNAAKYKNGEDFANKTLPKLPSLIQMENVKEDSKFIVVEQYRKRSNDDVSIDIGDNITLLKNYPDSWSWVKNSTTGKAGLVPKRCLQQVK